MAEGTHQIRIFILEQVTKPRFFFYDHGGGGCFDDHLIGVVIFGSLLLVNYDAIVSVITYI